MSREEWMGSTHVQGSGEVTGEERMSGTHRQVGHDQVLMAVGMRDRRGENCNGLEEESKDDPFSVSWMERVTVRHLACRWVTRHLNQET